MSGNKRTALSDLAPEFLKWPIPEYGTLKPDATYGETEAHIWQAGRCGACGVHESRTSKRHALDHDHDTGLVRGLLCTGCNLQEGWQPNFTFHMWRTGLNPCAVFGWHYLFQPFGRGPKPLRFDEAEALVRQAAVIEEERQRQVADAMQAMRESPESLTDALARVFGTSEAPK